MLQEIGNSLAGCFQEDRGCLEAGCKPEEVEVVAGLCIARLSCLNSVLGLAAGVDTVAAGSNTAATEAAGVVANIVVSTDNWK